MTVTTREQTSRNRIGTRGRWLRKLTNGGIDYKHPKVQFTGILAQRPDMVEVGDDGEPLGALPQDCKKSLIELMSNRDALTKEIEARIAAGESDPRASVVEDAEAFLNSTEERREVIEEAVAPVAVKPPVEGEDAEQPSEIEEIKERLKANQADAEAEMVDEIVEAPAKPVYTAEEPEMWGVDLYNRDALMLYAQALGMKMDGRSVRDCRTAIEKIKRRKRDLWQKVQDQKPKE